MKNKFCPKCKTEKPTSEFYKSKQRHDQLHCYCKSCFNGYVTLKRIEQKERAIIYKGSECIRCGLSHPTEPYYVFDFHHVNPKEKEFDWGQTARKSWDKQKKELDKCVLVCAICHRHIEYGDSTQIRTEN